MTSPPASGHVALSSQVGGHAGVLATEDGSLVIKPCIAQEVAFYQAISTMDALGRLQDLVPDFLGTLKVQSPAEPVTRTSTTEEGGKEHVEPVEEIVIEKEHIVLTNLAYAFRRPCVLDVKLGTVLHDEETASAEKKARMEATAQATTSFETGIRLTGFQNWDPVNKTNQTTPKAYGKSIKAAQLPKGIARFFPLLATVSSATVAIPAIAPVVDGAAAPLLATISNITEVAVLAEGISSSTTAAPSSPVDHTGVAPHLLLSVLRNVLNSLQEEVLPALRETEARFVGASLLIVYEGDREALAHAVEAEADSPFVSDEDEGNSSDSSDSGYNNSDVDFDPNANDDGGNEGKGGRRHRRLRPPPCALVRLIDFAHSRAAVGEGPDLGVIKGVVTLIELVEHRLREVEAVLGESRF